MPLAIKITLGTAFALKAASLLDGPFSSVSQGGHPVRTERAAGPQSTHPPAVPLTALGTQGQACGCSARERRPRKPHAGEDRTTLSRGPNVLLCLQDALAEMTNTTQTFKKKKEKTDYRSVVGSPVDRCPSGALCGASRFLCHNVNLCLCHP